MIIISQGMDRMDKEVRAKTRMCPWQNVFIEKKGMQAVVLITI